MNSLRNDRSDAVKTATEDSPKEKKTPPDNRHDYVDEFWAFFFRDFSGASPRLILWGVVIIIVLFLVAILT
jgi:hypothetical protein